MDSETSALTQESIWDSFWHGLTPETEIRMWDFYGGRQWILKNVPRYGKVLEAGCGLGRWVFYLTKLGIDIEGLDFHEMTVNAVKDWASIYGFTDRFQTGDVTKLPYDDESISGYLSFGVIEHFEEGPTKPLIEAYRVLKPGGVAVITTPSLSFSQRFFRTKKLLKKAAKKVLRRTIHESPFFQYWYTPRQLTRFIEQVGLKVMLKGGGDLKYSFWELGAKPCKNNFGFRVADWLENTPFAHLGAQAFTISIKTAPIMYCFLCGEYLAKEESLLKFYLPICPTCANSSLAQYYKKGTQRPQFHSQWEYKPLVMRDSYSENCFFCHKSFDMDVLFENFGFSVPVCPDCLKIPTTNIILSNKYLKPVWRLRK
jgi:ubiquinone/menaquinone biosynthesis C-methylase UbiE